MAVHLTRIYTRTGDDGTTGARRLQPGPQDRLAAGGLRRHRRGNAAIGVAVTVGGLSEAVLGPLRQVQNDLFDVGADLCTPIVAGPAVPAAAGHRGLRRPGWRAGATSSTRTCPKLDSFILPGGTPGAAYLHVARTVTRRAERSVWALLEADPERTNPLTATYLNRLSDLLFILGRVANPDGDVLWQPGGRAARLTGPIRRPGGSRWCGRAERTPARTGSR